MANLPDSWKLEKIENLCEFNPKHSKELSDGLDISFIPMSAVDDITGTIQTHDTKALGEVRKGYTHFAEEDVIFAKITPCMENGKSAIAKNLVNDLACGSTEFHVLRSLGGILPEYLHPYLRQQSYRDTAAQKMTGAVGQRRVPKQFILNTEIPLPPLNEQRRIVAKIEALTDRSRKAREALDAIPTLLDQFRQSVLAAAFRGDLTADWREKNPNVESAEKLLERIRSEFSTPRIRKEEKDLVALHSDEAIDTNIPPSWSLGKIQDICISSFYGPRFSKDEYTEDGIPSIRTTDMNKDGGISISEDTPRLLIPDEKIDLYKVVKGDLLVTRSGSIGVMAIFKEDYLAIPSAYLIRFRFVPLISVDYIYYYLKSPFGQRLLGLSSTAVTQPNINAEAIKRLSIPICSLAEEIEIVQILSQYFCMIEQIENLYLETKLDIDQLDQSILAKAFRGELVPQDPNDEPASALLERIRSEQEKIQKPRNGKGGKGK
jgi:type I restriction enzyme, S subunit